MEIKSQVQSSNLVDLCKNTRLNPSFAIKPAFDQDTFTYNEMSYDMKKADESKAQNAYMEEGTINGRKAVLKTVLCNDVGADGNIIKNKYLYHIEGLVDSKKLLISRDSESYFRETWKGEYNKQKVEINIEYGKKSKLDVFLCKLFPKRFYPNHIKIQGFIGNKKLDINIPGSQVPTDNELKDLTTIILNARCLRTRIINNKIIGYEFDNSVVKEMQDIHKERKEFYKENIKPWTDNLICVAGGMVLAKLVK